MPPCSAQVLLLVSSIRCQSNVGGQHFLTKHLGHHSVSHLGGLNLQLEEQGSPLLYHLADAFSLLCHEHTVCYELKEAQLDHHFCSECLWRLYLIEPCHHGDGDYHTTDPIEL